MTEPVTAPPLRVWIVALFTAAGCALALLARSMSVGAPASELFVEFNSERIAAYRDGADRTRPLIVMFGTSALKYATDEEEKFASEVSKRLGYPVDVLRIVNNWGVYGDFEPLMPSISELDPDLILLQQDLLVTDRPWWRHFLLYVGYLKWRLAGNGHWDYRNEHPWYVQFDQPCWKRPGVNDIETQIERRREWVIVSPQGPDARASREFVAAATANDLSVALVDVPRRPDLEREANAPRRAALELPAVEATTRSVATWIAPDISTDLFCDISHVSPEGRAVYSSWLEQRVAETLAEPQPTVSAVVL